MDMDSDFVQGPNRRAGDGCDSPESLHESAHENIPVCLAFMVVLFKSAALAQPGDLFHPRRGFVDFAPKPYRLMMRAKDPTAPDVQKIEAALRSDIVRSNIVRVNSSSGKNAAVGAKDKHAAPEFRLFRPDDRVVHSIRRGPRLPCCNRRCGRQFGSK